MDPKGWRNLAGGKRVGECRPRIPAQMGIALEGPADGFIPGTDVPRRIVRVVETNLAADSRAFSPTAHSFAGSKRVKRTGAGKFRLEIQPEVRDLHPSVGGDLLFNCRF